MEGVKDVEIVNGEGGGLRVAFNVEVDQGTLGGPEPSASNIFASP